MSHIRKDPVGALHHTFLLPFFGYCGQAVVGAVWATARGSWREGQWTKSMLLFMVLSSLGNGAAQAFDYVALTQAGITLFTILHSSVTLFACLIAVLVLRTRVNAVQWLSVVAVAVGLVLTAIPSPITAHASFAIGLASAIAGSLANSGSR